MGLQRIDHSSVIASKVQITVKDLGLDTNTPLSSNYNDAIQRRLQGLVVCPCMHLLVDHD